jgi:hypothetical protein
MPDGDLGKNSSGDENEIVAGKFVSGSPETFSAVNVGDHPPCEKVWVDGQCNKHGKWIEAHWRHQHWVPGHNNRHGEWIPGHCR